MPRQVESPTTKLLKLLDDLSPEEIRFAQEILAHAIRRDKEAKRKIDGVGPKRRKRASTTPPVGGDTQ